MPDLHYRPATSGDARAIAELFRKTRLSCLPYLPVLHTEEEDLQFFSTEVLRKKTVWLAEREGRVAGFCAFADGWLDHLYVEPSAQRGGIGGRLLSIALAENASLDLWVFQQNSSAIAFYEAHGFKLVKTTDGSGNEEQVPDALYRRDAIAGSAESA